MKPMLLLVSVMTILQGYQIKCCLEHERIGLLRMKSYFSSIPGASTQTKHPSRDCCRWEGVKCSPSTGRIMQLSLNSRVFPDKPWPLNMTLFLPFQELQKLDLSSNFIGSLSDSQGLCRLRNLQELNLVLNDLSGRLPDCLWNLTSLRVLDLSFNRLTGNLPPLSNLPSLEYLSIMDNNFGGKFSFNSLMDHSSLRVLILSDNALQVEFEDSAIAWPSNFQLSALGLGNCSLSNPNKLLSNFLFYQSNLQYIDLSGDGLTGSYPGWLLQNNTNLKYLNLANNLLNGSLQLLGHSNLSLLHLDISNNKLSGEIPVDIGTMLSSLEVLSMSMNSFNGCIPTSVGNMTQLGALDLSDNKLHGEVPRQLFSDCTLLQFLLLSKNKLRGEIVPSYMNLTRLISLDLGSNLFTGTIGDSLLASADLAYLDITNNEVRGELPSWIGSFDLMTSMSLARNQFHGIIPSTICSLEDLLHLDLSENRFHGGIPDCNSFSSLGSLHAHGNSLTGTIPKGLAMSSNLVTLDLANNQLSGGIPQWIGQLSSLGVLLLRNNHLQGELPTQLCQLQNANIIDISHNSISGAIPSCIKNMSFGARKMKECDTGIAARVEDLNTRLTFNADINFPEEEFVSFMEEEVDFIVKSNFVSYKGCILSIMSALDLSCNQLTGEIPPELGNLGMIESLNLSHNRLLGPIPKSFSRLRSIESLDLSNNNLSGKIPYELANLTFLEVFNVSSNNLSGQVPQTGQFGSFDQSSYRGNPLLCGSQLPRSCNVKETMSEITSTDAEGETRFDMDVFSWSFGASFITMLVATILILHINPHWCIVWFAFIDVLWLPCFGGSLLEFRVPSPATRLTPKMQHLASTPNKTPKHHADPPPLTLTACSEYHQQLQQVQRYQV